MRPMAAHHPQHDSHLGHNRISRPKSSLYTMSIGPP
jgi:hypothetical protein